MEMTTPKSPRIDINPSKTQRLDFDKFVELNLPGKRAVKLRMAFKLIWIAHQIYPTRNNVNGLRMAHYLNLRSEIEEMLSKHREREVKLDLPRTTIEKTLRHMRKAGYLRYIPLEDHWLFSGKASSTLRRLANKIDDYQKPAQDLAECTDLAEQLAFGLGIKEKAQ
jgi:hypothetical protein